jgi:hypothetical protein
MTTKFKEVSAERYDEMLGVLPPAMWLGKGFLVGEAWTHKRCTVTGRDNTPAFAPFLEYRGKFYEGPEPMTGAEFRALNPEEVVP